MSRGQLGSQPTAEARNQAATFDQRDAPGASSSSSTPCNFIIAACRDCWRFRWDGFFPPRVSPLQVYHLIFVIQDCVVTCGDMIIHKCRNLGYLGRNLVYLLVQCLCCCRLPPASLVKPLKSRLGPKRWSYPMVLMDLVIRSRIPFWKTPWALHFRLCLQLFLGRGRLAQAKV